MVKIKLISVIFCICMIFCSCTVQTDFDVYDFCRRFNKLSGEKILSTEDFLSDKNGSLYCFFTVGESTVLISMTESDNKAVENVYVTVRAGEYSENDLNEVINTVYRVFGAFNYGDVKKAEEYLALVGFDNGFVPFEDLFRSESAEKYKITLYSNEYAFTVSQEKIPLD